MESGADILAAARALGPMIRAEAEAIEAAGRLTDKVVAGLKEAGVFRMTMPRSMGGPELDPIAQLEIVEEVARADGSAGWVVMIGSDGGFYAAHLERDRREPDLRRSRRDHGERARAPRPRDPRGRRLSRVGPVALRQLESACGLVRRRLRRVRRAGAGRRTERTSAGPHGLLLPLRRRDPRHLADDGPRRQRESHDWRVADVFVPDELTFSFFEPAKDPAPLYAFPWFIVANAPGASLGIARASIDVFSELATNKLIMPGGHRLRDELLVQRAVAQAEATLGSAKSYLVDMTGRLWDTVVAGDPPTLAERAAFRLAGIHAFRASKSAVSAMYEAAGGTALYRKSPLDRLWRDISTISQHAFANEKGYAEVGRAMLGLDPQSLMI